MLFVGFFTSFVPYLILSVIYVIWIGISALHYVEQKQVKPNETNTVEVAIYCITQPVMASGVYYFNVSVSSTSETGTNTSTCYLNTQTFIYYTQPSQIYCGIKVYSLFSRPPPSLQA